MPKLIPKQKIELIRNLRITGHSIPEISTALSLPKSSVFRYIQGVDIASQYKDRLLDRRRASTLKKEKLILASETQAREMVHGLSKIEQIVITASLYWAEGAKKDFSFTNSDSDMVQIFVDSLRTNFGVINDDIIISVRLYDDLDRKKALEHWSSVIGVPLEGRAHINLLKGKKRGKLPYGTCRVRIRKASKLHKLMFSIINRMIEISCPHSSTDRTRDS